MATLTVLRGRARHVPDAAAWYGNVVAPRGIETRFRVDDQTILFAGAPALADGDKVTIAGQIKGRKFKAFALRNHSTGGEYLAPVGRSGAFFSTLVGLVLIACGANFGIVLAFPLALAGVTFALFGVELLARCRRNRRANEALLTACASARAQSPDGPSLTSCIATGVLGSLGAVFIAVALLLSFAVVTGYNLRSAALVPLVMGAGLSGFFGLLFIRTVQRAGLAAIQTEPPSVVPEHLASVREQLLPVASKYGGRVTAAEVAAALSVELEPARRVLDETVEAGHARLLFSPEAVPVYEFFELTASKANAKELWELD